MEAEKAKHKAIWDLYKAVWLMGQARSHLESIEHPALGDVECILDRLNEEYTGLLAYLAKSPRGRNLK